MEDHRGLEPAHMESGVRNELSDVMAGGRRAWAPATPSLVLAGEHFYRRNSKASFVMKP